MGIGKLAIAMVLIGVMVFGLVSAFSIAARDKTTDSVCNSTHACNGTVVMSEKIGTASVALGAPVLIIVGIIFLSAVFMLLRRSSK